MRMQRKRWLVPSVVVAMASGLCAAPTSGAAPGVESRAPSSAAATATTAAWGTTTSAPAGARGQHFGTGAGAPEDVWAVGGQNPGVSPTSVLTAPYAEHWNGTTWTATPVPLPPVYPAGSQAAQLESVASTGASDVWAVGHVDNTSSLASRTLAYHWDGGAWSKTATPNPGGSSLGNHLFAVAARGSNDVVAVGDSGFPARSLVLRWTGQAWTRVTTPNIGSLSAVALDATTTWVASGNLVQALVGGVWTRLPALPAGSGTVYLSGLASSATGLWAVGTDQIPYFEGYLYRPYAVVWNGAQWTKVSVPGSAGLSAVTAAGPDVLVTTGSSVVRLTPTSATVEVTPALGASYLEAVTADPTGQPWAVGWTGGGTTVVPAIINAPGINQGGISVTAGYSGASVTWIGPQTGSGSASVFGTFEVGGLTVGTYTVVVAATGCSPGIATVVVAAGLVASVDAKVTC